MWFDARAALARIRGAAPAGNLQSDAPPPAISAISAIQPALRSHNSRNSQPRPSELENAAPPRALVVPLHGNMVRLAWSGEWVSRAAWDAMSDLERHGPQGRLFCGKCWRWRDRATALACLDGATCQ